MDFPNLSLPDSHQTNADTISSNAGHIPRPLDELIEFDADVQEIQEVINKTTEETVNKVDWTKVWAEKYPILARYQDEVDVAGYEEQLEKLLANMEREYGYNALDAFLVLKDILGQLWNKQANK